MIPIKNGLENPSPFFALKGAVLLYKNEIISNVTLIVSYNKSGKFKLKIDDFGNEMIDF